MAGVFVVARRNSRHSSIIPFFLFLYYYLPPVKNKDMRNFLLLYLILFSTLSLIAQEDLPTDYLSKEFHAGRRTALRAKMPDKSVAIIMAFPTRTFSNDVEYLYHQNPDLYYFTGYKEPHSMLLVF
jgi:Xaa-Pro aminopeptidase